MKQEQVNKDLSKNATSEFQRKVVNFVETRIKASGTEMSNYHIGWEQADLIYRGYRLLDKKDKDAVEKNEPAKIIIPLSYALSQTALSFMMSTFFVDDRLFRLRGSGPEDQRVLEGMDRDVAYQVDKMGAYSMLYNWLQDALKYGVGIVKSGWVEEEKSFRIRKMQAIEKGPIDLVRDALAKIAGGAEISDEELVETIQAIKVFEGTKVNNISPYCFYPDPSVPLARFQDGGFVGHEEETTTSAMSKLKHYHGVSKIPDTIPHTLASNRTRRVGKNSVFDGLDLKGAVSMPGTGNDSIDMKSAVILVELEFTATRSSLKKDFEYELGPEFPSDQPIKMVASLANDQKVVQFEPLGYLHGGFNYDVIEYSPDHNAFVNPGLTDTVHNLQELQTWFLNSHVMNVRKAIKNRFIVDPDKIEVGDITAGKEYIRTKSMAGRSIRDAIMSLEVTDITRSHVTDMNMLTSIAQITTGISDTALGQFSTGRRSAREAGGVQNAAAARLKMHGMLAWASGIEPLGQKMVSNTNQMRTEEFYGRILGEDVVKFPYAKAIMLSPEDIVGGFNFQPYDGTMPSERAQRANYFTELLKGMLKNPMELQQVMNVDLQKILKHVFTLYGVRNFDDYVLNPQMLNQPLQAQVMPDQQAAALAASGQAQAMPDLGSLLAR